MLLLALIAVPAAAALLAACFAGKRGGADPVPGQDVLPGPAADAAWRFGLLVSAVIALLGLPLLSGGAAAFSAPWFTLWGTPATIHLSLASDGLSAWLAQLVTWLTPLAILGARRAVGERMREFVVCVLAMEALMLGALFARDLVIFYACFEGMLIPMLVLLCLFGGPERRSAALWFVLTTIAGSVFLLVAVWWLAMQCGTTDLTLLMERVGNLKPEQRTWLFWAFALAFAVKVPLVPLHAWQARTYAETPGAGVALLAGAMAKLGTYGFLRFCLPLFPVESAAHATLFIVLGLIATVGGALVAIAQDDAKRMLAYSSLSHLGLVMVGIFTFHDTALTGAAVQMVAHGLSVAALFLLVGFLESRTGSYGLDDFGGLADRAPLFALLFVTAALASAGLPGTANFIGEFQLLYGAFAWNPYVGAIAGLSVILGVVYLLTLIARWFLGRGHANTAQLRDLAPAEALAVIPLLLASIAFGCYPRPITDSAGKVVVQLGAKARAAHGRVADAAPAARPLVALPASPNPAASADPAAEVPVVAGPLAPPALPPAVSP